MGLPTFSDGKVGFIVKRNTAQSSRRPQKSVIRREVINPKPEKVPPKFPGFFSCLVEIKEHKGVDTIWYKAVSIPEKCGPQVFFLLDDKTPLPLGALNPNANSG